MKCPKCHYLSFEPEPRCRNCGFSFSLAEEQSDVLIRAPEAGDGPFADLDLRPASAQPSFDEPTSDRAVSGAALPPAAKAAVPPAAPTPPRPAPTTELPLFVKALTAKESEPAVQREEPLVKVPNDPRPPLAVRRKAADAVQRPRSTPTPSEMKKLGPFDRDLLEDLQRLEHRADSGSAYAEGSADIAGERKVGAGARAAAAAVDALLLGTMASAVVWITLRWCDLTLARVSVLPIAPTAAFLLLVGAGYLLMFTAFGGQTLGKMAFGIRVVSEEEDTVSAVSTRQAAFRAVLTLPSVLLFGVGFIPALIGDERALHDRLTHTRVVRA
ncbi:MAG: RDD family protein [Acidobacteria bacterium]|nr:RDD family protein [Acidobacteriota bacterium]